MTGEDPGLIVGSPELEQRETQVLEGAEVADPEQLFLEGPHEALGDAVALGFAYVARAGFDAEKVELDLEGARHVLRGVVVAQRKSGHDVLLDLPKGVRTPLWIGSSVSMRLRQEAAWMPTILPVP